MTRQQEGDEAAVMKFCEECGFPIETVRGKEVGTAWRHELPQGYTYFQFYEDHPECFNNPKLPAPEQPEDETTKGSGFICGAWTIREQGPILNYEQPYIRARYVYRCDSDAGHEGDHADSVLLTSWSGPTPEDAAKSKLSKLEDEEL